MTIYSIGSTANKPAISFRRAKRSNGIDCACAAESHSSYLDSILANSASLGYIRTNRGVVKDDLRGCMPTL
jgi:hypothetical protein